MALKPDYFIRVEHVTKKFGHFNALSDVSFEAQTGEFLSVLGPSGCGKTTLLRIIAGLETQNAGKVFFEGRDVSNLPVSKRNIGIVFQSYALFPNLTAAKNVAYGLVGKGNSRESVRTRVTELLDLVGLQGMGSKYPAQLSGGQQQRVALARAMALSPNLLLLDEPLSALDAQVRIMLRSEVRQLQRRLGVTTIMVTHDQEEALTMADRILVMDHGLVVQNDTPFAIYDKPATPFVASFIGSMNFLDQAVKGANQCYHIGGLSLRAENGGSISSGEKTVLAIRPEEIIIGTAPHGAVNLINAHVDHLEYRGSLYRLALSFAVGEARRQKIHVDTSSEKVRRLDLHENMSVDIQLPADRLLVYRATEEPQSSRHTRMN